MRLSILLLCAGCGSSFDSELFVPVEADGGMAVQESGALEIESTPESSTAPEASAESSAEEASVPDAVPEAPPPPTCEHLPYVGSEDRCGPGDTPSSSCSEVSRSACYRCRNGGQKSGCAAVVHVGASMSAPGDSWWCC